MFCLINKQPPLQHLDPGVLKERFSTEYADVLAMYRWVVLCVTNRGDSYRISVGFANASELARAESELQFPHSFNFEGREFEVKLYNQYPGSPR